MRHPLLPAAMLVIDGIGIVLLVAWLVALVVVA